MFWRKTFSQKLLKNFLCIARVRCGYAKHSPDPEERSALWIVTVRLTEKILSKEMWHSSIFLKIKFLKLCRTSEYSVNFLVFWRKLFFQKLLKNFLYIARVCYEYVKHCPSPEKCSALRIVAIRQKLRTEIKKVKGGKNLRNFHPSLVPMPRFKVRR